jgi:hypothetical protein
MAKKPEYEFIEPKIIEIPSQMMAVVTTIGDPNAIAEAGMKALYGAVYKLKFSLKKLGVEYKVEPLRARWPDAHLVSKDKWTGNWAIPIPESTESLIQKVPAYPVRIEKWQYGNLAQILHLGPFATEGPTVARLHEFITDSGWKISGTHEEHYLTRMDAKEQRTLIRYPVIKQ